MRSVGVVGQGWANSSFGRRDNARTDDRLKAIAGDSVRALGKRIAESAQQRRK